MGWLGLEGIEDSEGARLRRAAEVKRYAQRVLALYQQGIWDPQRAARAANLIEGLDDDGVFSPAQQAVLRRMARTFRALVQQHEARYHGGSQTGLRRAGRDRRSRGASMPQKPRRAVRITDVPVSGWEVDDQRDELGFLPALLGAAAPLVAGMIGDVLGGGKKSEPAPAAPAPPVIVTPGGGGAAATAAPSLPSIAGVVADQIRAVPANVRQQVADALRESLDRVKSGQQDATQLVADIHKTLGPQLSQQLQEVNQAALQRQATFEHNMLVDRDKRWKANADAQKLILARMAEMEKKLGTALVNDKRRSTAVARAFGVPIRYQ